jgi:hypothetical protein
MDFYYSRDSVFMRQFMGNRRGSEYVEDDLDSRSQVIV